MADFSVGAGFLADFAAIPLATADGEPVINNARLIRIDTGGDRFENFFGAFDDAGGLPTGTIRTYRSVSGGALEYQIANAGIDVEALRVIAGTGDPEDFLRLIFRGDDTLTGQRLDDGMAGYRGDDAIEGRRGDDRLRGMAGEDRLMGDAGDDSLYGGDDDDTLWGGLGDDRLDGGRGADRLAGGGGADAFVFLAPGRPDVVEGFAAEDEIVLGLRGLGPAGALDPDRFHVGPEATSDAQRVLYDIDAGWPLYAERGADSDDPRRIAWLGQGLDHLDAGDVVVI